MLLEQICTAANASIFRKIDYQSTKAIFHPTDIKEVKEAINYAKDHDIIIVVKGGGSSLSGAATGGHPEKVVISTNQYRNVLEINQKDKYAWVEPGITPVELNAILSVSAEIKLLFIPIRSCLNRHLQYPNLAVCANVVENDSAQRVCPIFEVTGTSV